VRIKLASDFPVPVAPMMATKGFCGARGILAKAEKYFVERNIHPKSFKII
jgi:hypothetical protein